MLIKLNDIFIRFNERFHNRTAYSIKIVFFILLSLMSSITVLVVIQYRYFKVETEKMLEIKEDYHNYVLAVKKILHDYHKNKERLQELETMLEEKKNFNEDCELTISQSNFPDGVRVYSSDDEVDAADATICTINRELDYLKQNALDYIKQQKINYIAKCFEPYLWTDYTEQIEQERSKEEARHKKKRKRSRHRSGRRQRNTRFSIAQTVDDTVSMHKSRDMHLAWPIDRSSFWLSSPFGPRKNPNGSCKFHAGIDMAAPKGTIVKAAGSGVIVEAHYASGYGNTVVIAHNHKYCSRYAHLNSISVKVGQKVEEGQRVGTVGATGFVRCKRGGDPSHLHLEVSAFGKRVNPIYFLRRS